MFREVGSPRAGALAQHGTRQFDRLFKVKERQIVGVMTRPGPQHLVAALWVLLLLKKKQTIESR